MDLTENTRIIDNPAAILHYMNQMHSQHVPIQINLSNTDQHNIFDTHLQQVDATNMRIILQKYFASEWQSKRQKPPRVEVKCQLSQGNISFYSRLTPLDNTEALTHCCLGIPGQLFKEQLRTAFRVSLFNYDTEISFTTEDGTQVSGFCFDFSASGMLCQARISQPVPELLVKEQVIPGCQVTINNVFQFSCDAVVRHVRKLDNQSFQLGLEFVELSPVLSNQIAKVLIRLEREHINSQLER